MIENLHAIPGRLKTLLDRLTASRAAKLDNLNTTISSRAPSSTALSTGTWTGARAAKLDNLDGPLSEAGLFARKFQLFTTSGTWNLPPEIVGDVVLVTLIGGGGSGNSIDGAANAYRGRAGEALIEQPHTVSGNVSVTVGAGGSSVTNNINGNAGSASSFGSLSAAGGGRGDNGSFAYANNDALPVVALGAGRFGIKHHHQSNSTTQWYDRGVNIRGTEYGEGGTASGNDSNPSGAGGNGAVLVEWWEKV